MLSEIVLSERPDKNVDTTYMSRWWHAANRCRAQALGNDV